MKIEAFPSPTKDYLTIKTTSAFEWMLFDQNGRLVEKGKREEGENEIDLSNLSAGMYFMRYHSQDTSRVFPFIKH